LPPGAHVVSLDRERGEQLSSEDLARRLQSPGCSDGPTRRGPSVRSRSRTRSPG
jgi:hypothetical protein